MFRLTKVRVQNFKCFEDTKSIKIEPRCTTLIGMNQAGKSSFLKAIYYLGNDETIDKGCWRNREIQPQIEAYFEAEKGTWAELIGDGDRSLLKIIDKLRHVRIKRDEESRSIEFLNEDGELITNDSLTSIQEKVKLFFLGSSSPIEEYKNITEELQGDEVLFNYLSIIKKEIPESIYPDNQESCIELLEGLNSNIEEALDKNIFSQEAQQQLTASINGFMNTIENSPSGIIESEEWVEEFENLVEELEDKGDLLDEATLKTLDLKSTEELAKIIDLIDTWKYPNKSKLEETLKHLKKRSSVVIPDLKGIVKKTIKTIYFEDYTDRLPNDLNVPQAKNQPMVKLLIKIAGISSDIFDQDKGPERQRKMEIGSVDFTKEMSKYYIQEPHKVKLALDGNTFGIRISRLLESGEEIEYPLPPEDLSRGMQWYLGFFTKFRGESDGKFKNAILLLDDVAVYLHPSGQRELLELFKEMSQVNQIIYSTHFPYLIPDDLYEIRVFVQRGRKSSEIYESFTSAPPDKPGEKDSLAPIRIWMGITLKDSLFSGEKTLIVEGVRDRDYLEAISRYRANRGVSNIEEILIHPAGNEDQAVNSGLFLKTEGKPFFVMLDSDKAGRERKKKSEKKYGDYIKGKIGLLDEMCGSSNEKITAIESFIKIGFPGREIKKSRKCVREFRHFLDNEKDDSLLKDSSKKRFWELCDNLFKAIKEKLDN